MSNDDKAQTDRGEIINRDGTPLRPGGWVEGIGWVALLGDTHDGDTYKRHWVLKGKYASESSQPRRLMVPTAPVLIVRWSDGSTPEPPKRLPDVTELPEWEWLKRRVREAFDADDDDEIADADSRVVVAARRLLTAVDSRGEN